MNLSQTLRRRLPRTPSGRMEVIAYLGVCAGLLLGLALIPGSGSDWFDWFDKTVHGCLGCGFYPYHFSWFLRPFSVFADWKTAYVVWIAISFVLLYGITRAFGGNPLVPLVAFTSLWAWWLGQVDLIPLSGVLLAWLGTGRKRPLLVGAGLVLLSTKPQIGALLILLFLWWNRASWKQVLILPILALALSAALYGPDWPLRWWQNTPRTETPLPAAHYVHHPILLVLLPGVFYIRSRARKLHYLLAVICCAVPYIGTYGYLIFLVFPVRWWEVMVGYLGLVGVGVMSSPWGLSVVILQPLLVITRLLLTERAEQTALDQGKPPIQHREAGLL